MAVGGGESPGELEVEYRGVIIRWPLRCGLVRVTWRVDVSPERVRDRDRQHLGAETLESLKLEPVALSP
jgi:hypothetical protein